MYSHIAKGFTLGHTFARLFLRSITSVPGIAIDLLVATLWVPNYSAYWEDNGVYYSDGIKAGVMQGVFGWVGEVLGYIIGAPIGSILGGIAYFPDGLARAGCHFNKWVNEKADAIADAIGKHTFFKDLFPFQEPTNYVHKAWNISVGTLGVAIGAVLAVIPKTIEFVLPFLGDKSSKLAWKTGAAVGGIIGTGASFLAYPIKHACDRLSTLYENFRDKIQSLTAFVYAKDNQALVQDSECCVPSEAVHSEEFRDKYNKYQRTSTAELLFGPFRAAQVQPAVDRGPLDDPIDYEIMEDPVVDRHGHTFSRKTINAWLDNHSTCPLSNQPLKKSELVSNLTVKDIVENYTIRPRK